MDTADVRLGVLRELRDNGRASYARIAERLGVTRRQVTQTVQGALDRDELRLAVSISPDLMGLERFAYLQIAVDGPVAPVRDALVAMPETTFVAVISGGFALDAEIRVGADPHLRQTVDAVRSLPQVLNIRTHIYESIEVNLFSPLWARRTRFQVDDADRAIVRHLQVDGRASFRELGAAAGVSPSGARLRFERLVENGAIKVVGIPVRGTHLTGASLGVGIHVHGRIDDAVARVRALEPEFLAVTVGTFDMIATVSTDSTEELLEVVDRLRGFDEVSGLESWSNLRIVKEQYGEGDRLSASPRTGRAGDPAGNPQRAATAPPGRERRR